MTIERPAISKGAILIAAKKVAERVDGNADDIANCYQTYIDGYELAKKLEDNYYWSVDMGMLDDLDMFHCYAEEEYKKELEKWVIDFNIKPPLKNGTKIKQGVINGIYNHGAAMYTVKENGCTMKNRHVIIKFEDAIEV